jgi:uncharacterized phage infection (PIP) family protein YhgE
MTQTPETPNDRIDQLEATLTRFAELSFQSQARQDQVLDRIESAIANLATQQQQTNQNVNAQSATIDVLVANIQQLTENVTTVTNRVDVLAIQAEQDRTQAAADRQQAAIDRQQATADREVWQAEIQRIWQYLLQQGGNGRGNGQTNT